MEKRKAAAEENGEEMSWATKRYFEKKENAKARACTFCKEEGHNRATCPKLAGAIKEYNKLNKKFREITLEYMKKNGIGVGMLINIPDDTVYISGRGYLKNQYGIVTDISWNGVDVGSANYRAPQVLNVTALGEFAGTKLTLSIPVHRALRGEGNPMLWSPGNCNYNVIGIDPIASRTSSALINPPEGWSGDLSKKAAKAVFKGYEWGGCYSHRRDEWIDGSCEVVERAKEWETWLDTDYADFLKEKNSESEEK
jgi:hypothetical protein